ncbi:DUF4215 domain-containing protein [Persicimonas caeni]|uniref:DUF4215 domain-containing protein n=1 Tax=Persicimonas caeni TaxID=2292766 RepID=A0A4Y6PXN7_PERCE|nr:DUF4215 domain-containing protein [Persicimonas caeni]QDG52757.1 DUF4215 domain-containing protein [Persicimonas caeni]QED33979.1 DUF4215 domain-containing protein [Persicimonas caeni]
MKASLRSLLVLLALVLLGLPTGCSDDTDGNRDTGTNLQEDGGSDADTTESDVETSDDSGPSEDAADTAPPPEICGDGLLVGDEACDDGNTDPNDGCDDNCEFEDGYACPTPGEACVETTCGDGLFGGGEECDDGNLIAGDGCDPLCREELIWDCEDGTCEPACGDGVTLYPIEECDDGNNTSGDGCSEDCTVEDDFTCTDFQDQTPETIEVPIVLRDFKGVGESGGHPDFERDVCGQLQGMVEDQLDADGKPVYTGAGCAESAESFAQWYRDVDGVNQTVVDTIGLTQRTDLDPSGRTYRFESGNFFPLTDRGFGNTPGQSLNFHFTSEFRSYFEYRGGETLEFTGDDDVWVFVNGRLAVDIGGIHGAENGSVALSDDTDPQTGQVYDDRFDIFEGGVYEIVVFQAERHTTQSNYRLTLSGFLNTGQSTCESDCVENCNPEAECGDGVLDTDAGEECDDGNKQWGDGCDGSCETEPGWVCEDGGSGGSNCIPAG